MTYPTQAKLDQAVSAISRFLDVEREITDIRYQDTDDDNYRNCYVKFEKWHFGVGGSEFSDPDISTRNKEWISRRLPGQPDHCTYIARPLYMVEGFTLEDERVVYRAWVGDQRDWGDVEDEYHYTYSFMVIDDEVKFVGATWVDSDTAELERFKGVDLADVDSAGAFVRVKVLRPRNPPHAAHYDALDEILPPS